MKRTEIADKYKWNLGDIFPTDEAWEDEFKQTSNKIKGIQSFKGTLRNKAQLLACLNLTTTLSHSIERLYCYSRMRRDEDTSADRYVSMASKSESLVVQYSTDSAFIESELSGLDEKYLDEVIRDTDFSEYDFMLQETLRQKKHILSEKEERILAMSQSATGMYREVFSMLDYVDLPLPEIKVDGQKKKLTHGSYGAFLENRDVKVRKAAFAGMYGAFKSLINTLATNFAGSVKSDNFYALARGYNSCIDKAMFVDDVPTSVYDNLIEHVGKNLKHLHRYIDLRKKVLGVKTLHMYDLSMSIISEYKMNVSYEKAYEIVMEGLKPLGKDYEKLLVRARDEGWTDVMESEGKRSGAYSWGAYGTHPYVLLNYSSTTHDIFTIAHEMGHAMHSYYSDQALPYTKAGYKIFVAEVASTVNEVLLVKDLLSKAENKEMRKFLLAYYLDMFRTTVFRQTMFAEYEKIVHEMEQEGTPLTVASLCDEYYALNKKYYGKSVKHDEDIKYEWARIPHFYNSFYVYKYATGLTSAVFIAISILNNPAYLEKYKAFLSAGGTKSPYEILKDTGVDLATQEPYEVAMKEFAQTLDLLIKEFE